MNGLLSIGSTLSSLLAAYYAGQPDMDIGTIQIESHLSPPVAFQSEEKEILNEMHNVLGSDQVARDHIQFAPSWIINNLLHQDSILTGAVCRMKCKEYTYRLSLMPLGHTSCIKSKQTRMLKDG